MEPLLSPRSLAFVGLGAVILANVSANLLMKLGASGRWPPVIWVLTLPTMLGICMFAVGVLAYAWSLRYVALHEAQIVLSLQYVGVILAAALVMGEHITGPKAFGITLIAIGLVLCMRS